MKKFPIFLIILSIVRVDVVYAKDRPLEKLWGNPELIHWDEARHVWVNDNDLRYDNWLLGCNTKACDDAREWFEKPRDVPVEKHYEFSLVLFALFESNDSVETTWFASVLALPRQRRFIGINVEEKQDWPEESRIWPHLGLAYIGTIAEKAGYEVVLWDELIQGSLPVEQLIRDGDVVGLSLVTTGIERGVDLARQIKERFDVTVVAGNDSTMFRAPQLLSLPDRPIDAVFTTNSLRSVRDFFRNPHSVLTGATPVSGVAVSDQHAPSLSNQHDDLLVERGQFERDEFFMVPNLGLYSQDYWNTVWGSYRSQFGHKHSNPTSARNATLLLAQGCGRAGGGDVCDYCTIRHVANVLVPDQNYIEETIATYKEFGINTFFNVTDSSFEMGRLADMMLQAGPVDTLVLYGRAQAIARSPKLLERWLGCVNDRLLINCGMDSGDERILQLGINKSSSRVGSRLEENKQAIRNIRTAGPKAHLHYSVIFGSTGETHDSCQRTLDFVQWSIDMLGEQLDVVEGDQLWVNFGAPCSEIFHDYEAAMRRAELAGKSISLSEWNRCFSQYADELIVPQISQEAWYHYFTGITLEEAWKYNAIVRDMVAKVPGSIKGREFAFRDPKV